MKRALFGVVWLVLLVPLLAQQPKKPAGPPKIQTLVITGQDVHDWRGVTPLLKKQLEDTGKFEVRVTEEFRGAGIRQTPVKSFDLPGKDRTFLFTTKGDDCINPCRTNIGDCFGSVSRDIDSDLAHDGDRLGAYSRGVRTGRFYPDMSGPN